MIVPNLNFFNLSQFINILQFRLGYIKVISLLSISSKFKILPTFYKKADLVLFLRHKSDVIN